jgi:hypothetical protein
MKKVGSHRKELPVGRLVYFFSGAAIGLVTPLLIKLARASYREFIAEQAPVDDDDEDSIKIQVKRAEDIEQPQETTTEPAPEPSV